MRCFVSVCRLAPSLWFSCESTIAKMDGHNSNTFEECSDHLCARQTPLSSLQCPFGFPPFGIDGFQLTPTHFQESTLSRNVFLDSCCLRLPIYKLKSQEQNNKKVAIGQNRHSPMVFFRFFQLSLVLLDLRFKSARFLQKKKVPSTAKFPRNTM